MAKKLQIIGSFILLCLNIYLLFKYNEKTNIIDKIRVENQLLNNDLKSWKDSYSRSRVEVSTINTDIQTLKVLYEKELEVLGTEFNDLNKDYKNLARVTEISTNTQSSVVMDASDNTFKYSDKWGYFNGYYNEKNEFILDYSINNDFKFIGIFKQRKLFNFIPIGRKTLMIEGLSYNPNTTITQLKNIDITPARRIIITPTPQIGYGYTQRGWGWYAGFGLGIRFNTY